MQLDKTRFALKNLPGPKQISYRYHEECEIASNRRIAENNELVLRLGSGIADRFSVQVV